jgi:hypothetical protein
MLLVLIVSSLLLSAAQCLKEVCVCGGGLWHGIGQGFGCAIDSVDVVTLQTSH